MKVGILCRENCDITRQTIQSFEEAGMKISLLLMETDERTKRSKTEKDFIQNHRIHHFRMIRSRKGSMAYLAHRLYGALPKWVMALRKKVRGKAGKPLAELAKAKGIALSQVARHSSKAACQAVEAHQIEYLLLASSAWLIKKPLLDYVKVINGHNALLPNHRGLDSMQWSVLEGDPTGITAHIIDEGVDTGPILKFREVKSKAGEDMAEFRTRIFAQRPSLFVEVIKGLAGGTITARPQGEGIHHRPMTADELWDAEMKLASQS